MYVVYISQALNNKTGQTVSHSLVAIGAIVLEAHSIMGTAYERHSPSLSFFRILQLSADQMGIQIHDSLDKTSFSILQT